MEELVNGIIALCDEIKKEAAANLKGNKAAGTRARKATLELEKKAKEYRKLSVEADKKK